MRPRPFARMEIEAQQARRARRVVRLEREQLAHRAHRRGDVGDDVLFDGGGQPEQRRALASLADVRELGARSLEHGHRDRRLARRASATCSRRSVRRARARMRVRALSSAASGSPIASTQMRACAARSIAARIGCCAARCRDLARQPLEGLAPRRGRGRPRRLGRRRALRSDRGLSSSAGASPEAASEDVVRGGRSGGLRSGAGVRGTLRLHRRRSTRCAWTRRRGARERLGADAARRRVGWGGSWCVGHRCGRHRRHRFERACVELAVGVRRTVVTTLSPSPRSLRLSPLVTNPTSTIPDCDNGDVLAVEADSAHNQRRAAGVVHIVCAASLEGIAQLTSGDTPDTPGDLLRLASLGSRQLLVRGEGCSERPTCAADCVLHH